MIINQASQLVHLVDTGELHFVDHEDLDSPLEELTYVVRYLSPRLNCFCFCFDTNPTGHHPIVATVAERPQGHITTSLTELPTQLEGERRLSRGHRPVRKSQFRHWPLASHESPHDIANPLICRAEKPHYDGTELSRL